VFKEPVRLKTYLLRKSRIWTDFPILFVKQLRLHPTLRYTYRLYRVRLFPPVLVHRERTPTLQKEQEAARRKKSRLKRAA
jgi:hypothetical protein